MTTAIRQPNYRLRRFVAALVLAILATIVGSFVQWQGAEATNTSATVEFKYVSVNSGESLWSLAEKYAPQTDPRDWIERVVSLNQLKSTEVAPGQRIALP